MMLDNVILIQKPEPDSHYRLRPCKCKSDNVAYEQYNGKGGAKWRVKCYDCGFSVDKGNRVQHDAQNNWNQEVADGSEMCILQQGI